MSKLQVDQLSKTSAGADTFVLPAADGTVGQLMKTDGSGNLGFVSSAVGGKILQVLEDNLNTAVNTSSTSYVASGLTVTITPASTASKFLLLLAGGEWGLNAYEMATTFYVDTGSGAAEVAETGPYEITIEPAYNYPRKPHSAMCLHSPSTTSATTYTVYYKTTGGTGDFNVASSRVVFTVMELSS